MSISLFYIVVLARKNKEILIRHSLFSGENYFLKQEGFAIRFGGFFGKPGSKSEHRTGEQ